MLRNRLQKGDQKEFIIDLTPPPGELEMRRYRFAPQFQAIWKSGIETDDGNGFRGDVHNSEGAVGRASRNGEVRF